MLLSREGWRWGLRSHVQVCCYRGSLILGIMHVYLTAHMREGISARPGVTGGVTGSGGTSNKIHLIVLL